MLRLAIVAALALLPAAARADIKALEEAAKKEGELTWYVAHYTSEGAEDLGRNFGFGGIASGAAGIAKILFFVFIVVAVISLVAGFLRR